MTTPTHKNFKFTWFGKNRRGSADRVVRVTPGGLRSTQAAIKYSGPARHLILEDLSPEDRRVQISAARLRVTLDEKLDRVTPPEVKALSKQKP